MNMIRSIATVVLALAGLVVLSPQASAIETGDVVTTHVDADFVRKIVLQLPPVQLTQGEPRFFYGYYAARSDLPLLQGGQIRCGADGQVHSSVNTTMDHPGAEAGTRVVAVRWLFTPPVTGTYTCAMNGFATHIEPEGRYLTVVPGTNTRLIMSDAPSPGGAEWRQPSGDRPRVDIDDPATPAREDLAEVAPPQPWTAPAGARSVAVRSGIEMSRVSSGGRSPFVAGTTLVVTQLDANGAACTTPASETKATTFDVHHIKIHHSVVAPVNQARGCTRTFAITTRIRYVPHPDPTITRHAGVVENGVYTNTIATPAG